MECLQLRVQALDFEYQQILVRNGKGGKDRVTVPPRMLIAPLQSIWPWFARDMTWR